MCCRLFLAFLLTVALLRAAEPLEIALGTAVSEEVGLDWTLRDGQRVHLRVVDQQFHLLFLDAERNIMKPAFERAIVRGEETRNKTNELNLLLTPGADPSLTHVRRIYPPHDYWLRLLVPVEGTDDYEALPRQRLRQ
ncbi:MAG: hypothetical protein ACLFR7_01460 [Opitutales bacterium]